MDTNYTTQLFVSILFFAPGVLLFAGLAFVGILMALEKTFFSGDNQVVKPLGVKGVDLTTTANPAPGRLVATLKEGAQEPAAKRQHRAGK
jgi:hypothetical protein